MQSVIALIFWQLRAVPRPDTMAGRFAHSMDLMQRMIANFGNARGPTGPFIAIAYHRIGRMARRLDTLLTQYAAGTLPPPRPKPGPRRTAAGAARKPRPNLHQPTRFGWMAQWVQLTTWSSIDRWMQNPDMLAFIEAVPQAGRVLRPLCHMLAVDAPACLQRPRQPRKKPAARKPATTRRPLVKPRRPPPPKPPAPHPYRATPALHRLYGRLPRVKTA